VVISGVMDFGYCQSSGEEVSVQFNCPTKSRFKSFDVK
jgi:hypothetical protein